MSAALSFFQALHKEKKKRGVHETPYPSDLAEEEVSPARSAFHLAITEASWNTSDPKKDLEQGMYMVGAQPVFVK